MVLLTGPIASEIGWPGWLSDRPRGCTGGNQGVADRVEQLAPHRQASCNCRSILLPAAKRLWLSAICGR